MSKLLAAIGCLLGALALSEGGHGTSRGAQDPVRPVPDERPAAPPQGVEKLPTLEEPYVSPIARNDLLQRFDRPDPIEGLYELRSRTQGGVTDPKPHRGWLFVGKRHLSIYLHGTGARPDLPLLRAGVRRWWRDGNQLHLTVLGGHFTDAAGGVSVERADSVEVRRVEIAGATLRVHQENDSWLEFVRIE